MGTNSEGERKLHHVIPGVIVKEKFAGVLSQIRDTYKITKVTVKLLNLQRENNRTE